MLTVASRTTSGAGCASPRLSSLLPAQLRRDTEWTASEPWLMACTGHTSRRASVMARSIDGVLDRLLSVFLPPCCVLCGRLGQRPGCDLCVHCSGELPRFPGTGLQVSWYPADRLLARHAYTPPIDVMIQAFKYDGRLALGRVLGELLADGVTELGLHHDVDCLLPVPLHPHRYAERGFNQ